MKKKTDGWLVINIIAAAIFLLGIVFIIWGPLWFTSAAKSAKYNFTETGNIGATIGGITASIIGITTAALMYLAFFAQYQANRKQWLLLLNNQELNNLNVINDELETSVKELGSKSIENFVSIMSDYTREPHLIKEYLYPGQKEFVQKLIFFILKFNFLFEQVKESSIDKILKENFRMKFIRYFQNLKSIQALIEAFELWDGENIWEDDVFNKNPLYEKLIYLSDSLKNHKKILEHLYRVSFLD